MKRISLSQYPAVAIRLLWALFVLWVSRFVFFIVNAQHFQGIDGHGWGSVLWGGLRFDIAAICYLNSLYVLLQVLPTQARYHPTYQKFSAILFGITNGFGLLANCVDTFYFSFTLRRTTSSVLKEFSNEEHLSQILLTSASHYWYFIPIFLVSKVNGTEISYVIKVSPGFLTTVLLTMTGWFTWEGPLPF